MENFISHSLITPVWFINFISATIAEMIKEILPLNLTPSKTDVIIEKDTMNLWLYQWRLSNFFAKLH